jgi:putative ATP-dependent endonuclease of the OLD family
MAPEVGLARMLGELSGRVCMKFETLEQVSPYLHHPESLRRIGNLAHKCKWIKKDYDLCFKIGSGLLALQGLIGGTSINEHLDQIFGWLCSDA